MENANDETTDDRADAAADAKTAGRARARKLVHWATGDREHEAAALVDEAHAQGTDVPPEDAEREVHRTHGDLGLGTKESSEPDVPEVATVADPAR